MRVRGIRTAAAALAAVLTASALAGDATSIEHLNLSGRSDELPFSHVAVAGNTIYVAGSIGIDRATGKPPEAVADEVKLLMEDVKAKLALAGATMDDVVNVQVFCPDLSLYEEFNRIYRTYFERGFPARAFIGSGPLLLGGRFEMNAIAVRH